MRDLTISHVWLKYRKSVSTNAALLEWTDHDSSVVDLYGEDFIDCLGGFGIYTCGHRNEYIVDTVKAQLGHQALHSQELLDPLRGYSVEEAVEQFGLTKKESDILDLLVKGYSNKEICDKMVISSNTVKKHILNIYRKLNIKNRVQLLCMVKEP